MGVRHFETARRGLLRATTTSYLLVTPPPNLPTPQGFVVNSDCKDAWEKMCNDNDPCHFVVGKYSSDYKSLELSSSGDGRLSAFITALTTELGDDKIGWGGFRCYGVDDRGNTVSKRAKIVFIQYMPPNAPAMKKAKMGSHKGAAKAGENVFVARTRNAPPPNLLSKDILTKKTNTIFQQPSTKPTWTSSSSPSSKTLSPRTS